MASEEIISMEAVNIEGGKITFAPDVISTIASLAAAEVEGVEGMSGNVVEGLTGILNKRSITKGVKVEVNENTAAIDINVIIKYGYKIHEVAQAMQRNVKTTIENMTGLSVTAVNVYVQSIAFEKDKSEKAKPAAAVVCEETAAEN